MLKAGWKAGWGTMLAATLAGACGVAVAAEPEPYAAKPWQLNMPEGVTQTSQNAYDAHMLTLWICVVIGIIVFGAMAWAMFKHRHSKGAVPAQFSHNTKAEIVWTVIPVILLVIMAWPATAKLIQEYDTNDAALTVKITGYQWMWGYKYEGTDVAFTSRLAAKSNEIRQSGQVPTLASDPHYLLEVDHPLVLPVDTKVRFVITSDDVIHAWWVPALGWKQDAIPGFINEAWTSIEQPGVYRGQCAELCGKDHGFMPIVVKAVSQDEFDSWLAAEKAKRAPAEPAAPAAAEAPAEAPAAEPAAADAVPLTEQAPADAAAAG